jgi:hypothetical protein
MTAEYVEIDISEGCAKLIIDAAFGCLLSYNNG